MTDDAELMRYRPIEPLLVRPEVAAKLLGVSRRKMYDLLKLADFRDAVVEIPSLRGIRVRVDILRRAIERLSNRE